MRQSVTLLALVGVLSVASANAQPFDSVDPLAAPADGNVFAFIDDDSFIEINTGITIDGGKSYKLTVASGNPSGPAGQADGSLQAWVIPATGGPREFIGQVFETFMWNDAPDGGWVDQELTFDGSANFVTGAQGPVAGGELVLLSSNFDASCCGAGEAGRVYFDNYRVDEDGSEIYQHSFENAGLSPGGEGEVADAGWSGDANLSGIMYPVPEPSSLVLVTLLGVGGLAWSARARRKS